MLVRPTPVALILALALAGAAEAGSRPLTWPGKTASATEDAPQSATEPAYVSPPVMAATTPPPAAQAIYGAPPSPYGQVGDPFLHHLATRPAEAGLPLPARHEVAQPAVFIPPPVRTRPSVIMPPLAPAPALPLDMPAPPQVETPPVPKREGVYQIPEGSKYYRGNYGGPRAELNPPAKSETNSTDQPFVPGEIATDPRTQSARVYSLHRQYGLTPDAISSVSDNAPQPASDTPSPPRQPSAR